MSKTATEIIQAHKRTIEAFTKQECTIILTDRVEATLKTRTLTDILLTCEKFNTGSYSINSKSRIREVVNLRKIFCLIAERAGYSARKTGMYLNTTHDNIIYLKNEGKEQLKKEEFKRLYNTVLTECVSS